MNNNPDDARCSELGRHFCNPASDGRVEGIAPTIDIPVPAWLPVLDMRALRRVSQTLATEVTPARRLDMLLHAAMQATEATSGLIAAMSGDSWETAASATAADAPDFAPGPLPTSILSTAIRLHSGLALHDARAADHWQADDYVCRRRPRSVICVPMRCHGTLVGALYLEHRDLSGVFTPTKIAMVEIIALQAGFALENARLHDELSVQYARLSSTEEKMRDTLSELARASQLKAYGEMVASIVHEVAQPVTALDTSARAGLRWLDRSTPNIDAAREMLAHISACAMRARSIISGLRAQARQAEPAFTVFALDESVREVAQIVACTLDAMHVRLRVEGFAPGTPVRGERVQLEQAIISLLVNGAEAMLGLPTPERQLLLRCEAHDDVLRIHIDDGGEGFHPKLAERLFEPLFTTKPNGMGMGLTICKSIVDAHDGQLDLTPRPGGGTRATITLPRLVEESVMEGVLPFTSSSTASSSPADARACTPRTPAPPR